MNKNNKPVKNAKRGVGRPMATIKIPNRKFTFDDLKAENTHVTPLTLRKFIARDMFMCDDNGKPDRSRPRRNSSIVLVKDDLREPNSAKGLGRKCLVYSLRSKVSAVKTAKTPKVTATADTVSDYEAQKAALLAPEPTVTVPVVDITPATVEAPATSTLPVIDPAVVS